MGKQQTVIGQGVSQAQKIIHPRGKHGKAVGSGPILVVYIAQRPIGLRHASPLVHTHVFNVGKFQITQFIPIPAPRSASRRIRHSHVAPRINLFEEDVIKESDVYVLNIVTANRRGLLANIAKILSDMDIGMIHAHVMTLDERVEDTFLLKSARLADTKTQLQLKQALQDILVTS